MTPQQRTALIKANKHRHVQADFKRMLRGQDLDVGKLMIREVIGEPASELAAMRVESLLRSMRSVGPDKALAYCRRSRVSATRKVGELTANERNRLDTVLR